MSMYACVCDRKRDMQHTQKYTHAFPYTANGAQAHRLLEAEMGTQKLAVGRNGEEAVAGRHA